MTGLNLSKSEPAPPVDQEAHVPDEPTIAAEEPAVAVNETAPPTDESTVAEEPEAVTVANDVAPVVEDAVPAAGEVNGEEDSLSLLGLSMC